MAKGLFNIDTAAHPDVRENVAAGILGAFLFALGGGLIYILFAQIGFIAGISGFIAVFLAIKGYQTFGKKLSKRGVIIAVVIAFLVLLLAWYLSLSIEIFKAYNELYKAGDLAEKPKFFECVLLTPQFFKDPDFLRGALINLAMGLLFAALGSVALIANTFRQIKASEISAAAQAAAQTVNNAAGQAENVINDAYNALAQAEGVVNNVYDAAYTEADDTAKTVAAAADDAVEAVDATDAADGE